MKRDGFTLVELMVIIVIIGILAVVGVTKYSEYINKARVNTMVTTVRRIEDAQILYSAKNISYAKCENHDELKNKLGVVPVESDYFTFTVELGSDSSHYNIIAEVTRDLSGVPAGQQVIITDSSTSKLLDPSERKIVEYARSFFDGYPLEN